MVLELIVEIKSMECECYSKNYVVKFTGLDPHTSTLEVCSSEASFFDVLSPVECPLLFIPLWMYIVVSVVVVVFFVIGFFTTSLHSNCQAKR